MNMDLDQDLEDLDQDIVLDLDLELDQDLGIDLDIDKEPDIALDDRRTGVILCILSKSTTQIFLVRTSLRTQDARATFDREEFFTHRICFGWQGSSGVFSSVSQISEPACLGQDIEGWCDCHQLPVIDWIDCLDGVPIADDENPGLNERVSLSGDSLCNVLLLLQVVFHELCPSFPIKIFVLILPPFEVLSLFID